MNYPRVLQNPQFIPKPKPKEYDDNLDFLYQKRKKVLQSQDQIRNNKIINQLNYLQIINQIKNLQLQKICVPPPGFKKTLKQLTTAKPESKALIYNQTYKDYDPQIYYLIQYHVLNKKWNIQIYKKDINDSVISATSFCSNIHTLILSGSTNVSDSSVGRLSSLHKLKQLKLGDNTQIYIAQSCSKLEMLKLNNCTKLGEQGLEEILQVLFYIYIIFIQVLSILQVISINFTPEISDTFLQEKRNEYPKVNIIRTINKMTDPKDDGLRMPLPLENPKKKKKK
ncbi:unnamed protein product [Paramecium sonneborni]|uniref:Uncharacterized protein n=1 Tax=Paramecium sonneborni TaxID=65129 RepID=A0A8S1P8E6_9CILI|nr:unnamed protein product [Paramecium sonneborni]